MTVNVERAVISYLIANAAVSAAFVNRIYPVARPQGGALPALVAQRISGGPEYADDGETGLFRARIQIDTYALTYAASKDNAALVAACLSAVADVTHNGIIFRLITLDNEQDRREGGANERRYEFRTVQDFIIWYELAPTSVVGSLSVTLADATLVATGEFTSHVGAVAVTLADAALVATGVLPIHGAVAVTLADATLSATGDLADLPTGVVNVTLADATLSATGVLPIKGVVNVTLADATLSATGDLAGLSTGSLSVTLEDATLVATGVLPITGAVAATLEDATLSATGAAAYENIVFTHTGATFAPRIVVSGTPTILWTFSDSTTDNTATPNKDFGSAATRQTTLSVTPWSALQTINIGYDAGDNGPGDIDLIDQQNVTAVDGLNLVADYLQIFAGNHNPITTLNFSNFTALLDVELYQCNNLATINVSGATAIERLCVEQCGLTTLDISTLTALEDLRAAAQRGGNQAFTITWATSYANAWHICIRNNMMTANIPQDAFPSVQELWIWESNQSGAFAVSSSAFTSIAANGNNYTSVDLAGLITTGRNATVEFENNDLASIDISSCPGISSLQLNNNLLNQAAVDGVLATLDGFGTSGGAVDVRNNAGPSEHTYVTALEGRGWTVERDAYDPPLRTGALAVTLADATLAATLMRSGSGTVNATLADATLSATGVLPIKGAVNATLADATLSATGEEPTSATLTVTYRTTSAMAGSGGSPYTVSNVAIGDADSTRVVVACIDINSEGGTISSVTIGGVTATLAVGHAGVNPSRARTAIYYAEVSTGTTANVVVTTSATLDYWIVISVYTMTGSATYSVDSTTAQDFTDDTTPGGVTYTVDVPAGGAAFFVAGAATASSLGDATWINATEDALSVPGLYCEAAFAHLTTATQLSSYSIEVGGLSPDFGNGSCSVSFGP